MKEPGKKSQNLSVSAAMSRLISIILKMPPKEIFATLERLESKDERRYAERINYFTPLDYVVESKLYSGFINNISSSGIYVETSEIFKLSDAVTLSFPLPRSGEHIKVTGKIVRLDVKGFGAQFDMDLVELLVEMDRAPDEFSSLDEEEDVILLI